MSSDGRETNDLLVAFSALPHTAAKIALPMARPGVRYAVICQGAPLGALAWQDREDVRLHVTDGQGISRSRNSALAIARSENVDLLLFCDDDIDLDFEGLSALRAEMINDPALALAAGWRSNRFPLPRRRAHAHSLSRYNAGRLAGGEFMVRVQAVWDLGIRFDEAFGVGARHPIGEEFIFVTDLIRAGARANSYPISIGHHRGLSSGEEPETHEQLSARTAVYARVFESLFAGRVLAVLARIAFAVRHRRRFIERALWWRFVLGRLNGSRI